ncbi:Penicillin-binding protein 4 Short=PBP-4 [Fibrisoma limi BUZ 3]|uniref:Penicillin-binding protein 4 Short=PBP-4 n=1 Tax=Fibrisoma limi BUZ 3 TaxID=1185876 RepID=I2GEW7_9BACT|nr:serine hydrolase domain-containing protein [Fibrisoma limi]CCH52442.1 Penicillin-binding protein 4 Short=PBP-4 [Fibrisoma limi BUZ 3]
MKYLLTPLLLLWLIPIVFGQQRPFDVEQRVKQVETGLMPAVQIADQTPVRYTLTDRMRQLAIPAVSIAVINNGQLEWAKAYGYLSRDSLNPADTQTLFQAASISKPVAALGALKLVEQGELSLDADINQYLKSWKIQPSWFTEKQPVTLRGLLSHTAGLTVHGFGGYAKDKDVPTLVQILNGAKPANSPAVVSDTTPGVRVKYSGGGYVVMQQAIEDVTGETFPAFMQKTVLGPFGMTRSTYEQPLPASLTANASVAHYGNGRTIPGNWHTYPEMAPAGLWTTPSDLARYIIDVQHSFKGESTHILSAAMTKAMLTPQIGGHGLGPAVTEKDGTLAFSHGGSNAGYKCQFWASADKGQGVVIMTNADRGMEIIQELMRSVSAAYGWTDFKPVTKKLAQVSSKQLGKLAGRYTFRERPNLILEIATANNGLLVKQLWNQYEFRLLPESNLAYFAEDDGGSVRFETATDGTITGLLAFGRERWTKVN